VVKLGSTKMWKTIPYKGCVYFSIILNLVLIVCIFVLKQFLPPVVPLFYGLPSGAEQLVPVVELLVAPAIGLVVTILNVVICNNVDDLFLKRTFIISSVFVSILLAITVVKVIFLVGFF
jgi:hypothetical protein